jgi:hypothetical protein
VREAVATRVAADQALRERTESPDLAAEADELLHLNLSDEEKDVARGRLGGFFDHSTKEQLAVFAWLMSHYAARSEFTDLLQHARTAQAAQMKFDPTLWPYLQNTLVTIGQARTGKSFVIRACFDWLMLNGIPFVVMAPTGCAASLVGGFTIHSMAGLSGRVRMMPSARRCASTPLAASRLPAPR